jgi:hypothetical protein
MNNLFALLVLVAVIAVASAQYYASPYAYGGAYGYRAPAYGYSGLGYSGLGYAGYGSRVVYG